MSPTQTEIVLKGADKAAVGQVAATSALIAARSPYKGKGVRYSNEVVRTKKLRRSKVTLWTRKQLVSVVLPCVVKCRNWARLVWWFTVLRVISMRRLSLQRFQVLASASTVESTIREQVKYTSNADAAAAVGKAIAERALAKDYHCSVRSFWVPISRSRSRTGYCCT